MDHLTTKTAAAFGLSIVADRMLFGETDMMKNTYFAVASSVGIYSAHLVTPLVNLIPIPSLNASMYDGKTLTQRIAEVGTSSVLSYALNRYIFRNDEYANELMYRIGTIVAIDFGAEYVADYMTGQPLEFLTGN